MAGCFRFAFEDTAVLNPIRVFYGEISKKKFFLLNKKSLGPETKPKLRFFEQIRALWTPPPHTAAVNKK
jgi:hypothetical protein